MSMMCCSLCGDLVDTDYFPEGFYVKDNEDKFICNNCVERKGLEYEY